MDFGREVQCDVQQMRIILFTRLMLSSVTEILLIAHVPHGKTVRIQVLKKNVIHMIMVITVN